MSRILVTGASGDLGRPVSAFAASSHEVAATYYHNPIVGGGAPYELDLQDRHATLTIAREFRPDVIIHTAISDRSALDAMSMAARHLIEAAETNDARLIVLSTDMVFDGKQPPYRETDPPTPISDYGRAKAEMETLCLHTYPNCAIIRTSLIYDFDPSNRQIRWMLDQIEANQPVTLFSDEIRNPVYAWNLAEALLELASNDFCGMLHIAGAEPMSRYTYGCLLLEAMQYKPSVYVQAVEAKAVAPQRPRDLTLDLTFAQSILRTPLLSVEQAIAARC